MEAIYPVPRWKAPLSRHYPPKTSQKLIGIDSLDDLLDELLNINPNETLIASMTANDSTDIGLKEKSASKPKPKSQSAFNPPKHEIEAFARCILPAIQAYFESEDGKREFAIWQQKQQTENNNLA